MKASKKLPLGSELGKHWETIVGGIKDGLMIVDKEGCIVFANRALAELTGYREEELIGQKCSVLGCSLFNLERAQGGRHWCVLMRTGEVDFRRCTIMRKDSKLVPVLKNASRLADQDGEVLGAVETITDLTEMVESDSKSTSFRHQLVHEGSFHGIIGISHTMRPIFRIIESAARCEVPVLILGESGTGKELVARTIHQLSKRCKKPLVSVNCAALSESLLESELFGHVKGAYTGAHSDRIGRFELARGGSVFLDEIGDLSPSIQVKLLRVLEEKTIERVGESRPVPVNVRIISATNQDLRGLLESGRFRKDLYFRINTIPIKLPPLRERVGDIPVLVEQFFEELKTQTGSAVQGIEKAAMDILQQYPWPGNVRELKSALAYVFAICADPLVQPVHLPSDLLSYRHPAPSPHPGKSRMQELKKQQLVEALAQARGNKSRAAEILGISRVTVWSRLKRYGLADDQLRFPDR